MMEYISKQLAVEELENLRQQYEMHDDCDELVARKCKNAVSALPAADVAPVVRCRECIMHGNCTTEDVFNCSGMDMDEAFCCAGKRKNGDVNGKLSMPPQLREAEGAKLWEV